MNVVKTLVHLIFKFFFVFPLPVDPVHTLAISFFFAQITKSNSNCISNLCFPQSIHVLNIAAF